MLKELTDQIIEYVKDNVEEFNEQNVARYINQFESNSSATFPNNAPVCFIELLEAVPTSIDAEKKSINKDYYFRALVGRDYEAAELAEKVFDALDGCDTSIEGREFDVQSQKIFLIGWFGRLAVYEIQFIVQ